MQPSDGMILVIGPRLEGHSVIFLAIQTHLSCRFLLAVDSLGHLSPAEGIVKLPVGEQPGIRGDLGTVEFKLQSTVKNDPKAPRF